jgi:hypothetical protein
MVDTSLVKKLGIKPKQRLIIQNAPDGYAEQIRSVLPADVELVTSPSPAGNFDIVIQFVRNKDEVEQDTPIAIELVKPGGRLWLSYPKQSSKVSTDINRDILWKDFLTVSGGPLHRFPLMRSGLRFASGRSLR